MRTPVRGKRGTCLSDLPQRINLFSVFLRHAARSLFPMPGKPVTANGSLLRFFPNAWKNRAAAARPFSKHWKKSPSMIPILGRYKIIW
jgi:hypothetical protein